MSFPVGLQVAFNWRVLAMVEKVGVLIWNRLAPHARGLIPASSITSAAGLGLFWGSIQGPDTIEILYLAQLYMGLRH